MTRLTLTFRPEFSNIEPYLSKEIPIDSLKAKAYIVAVNPEKLQYKLYQSESSEELHPLKVFENQLWSYERVKGAIVVHQLNSDGQAVSLLHPY